MADPLEKVTLMSPHGLSAERMSRSTGLRITASDVAAALGKVGDPKASMFAHILAGSDKLCWELERQMLMEVVELAVRGEWRLHRASILRSLTRLAILEALAGTTCGGCNGHGRVPTENGWRVCPRCAGLKYSGLSGEERAEYTGIHRSDWSRRWSGRYRQVAALVDGYRDQVREALRREFRG